MMLSPELLKQIKQIQLKAAHLTTNTMVGEYSSAFKGLGQEFDKVREYNPGDDVRTIDWNVTARMREPFVKVYKEEREMTVMIMVDVSPSQQFGSTGRFKQELSAELAAVLAFLAIKNNDKVGLIVFSDHVEHFIKPQKGRAHVWKIIRSVLSHKSTGKKTDIAQALSYLNKVCHRKSMCFLISDFEAEDFEQDLRIAARRHDLICALTSDPMESELPSCGLIEFLDFETGEMITCDTSHKETRKELKKLAHLETEKLTSFFKKQKVDAFQLSTKDSVVKPLTQYFRQRERRIRS